MSIKIWHDNSGKTRNDSSWYLKQIIVHDLQTRNKLYFICEKWMAVDKEDFQIERIITLSSDEDKKKFRYLFTRETKQKLSDGHLWLSIFARPIQSSFSRLDRLTCCFVLLTISMLMNIMYYGMDNSATQDGIQIGPANITIQQISVGIITNLVVFPPTLLLVQLFRRTKPKNTRLSRIKSLMNKENDGEKKLFEKVSKKKIEIKKKKFEIKFPWWFKIIAYIISFIFAAVSLFFVAIKGITFGNEKVAKWLTSVIISFVTSVLITQPLQVIYFFDKISKQQIVVLCFKCS